MSLFRRRVPAQRTEPKPEPLSADEQFDAVRDAIALLQAIAQGDIHLHGRLLRELFEDPRHSMAVFAGLQDVAHTLAVTVSTQSGMEVGEVLGYIFMGIESQRPTV